VGSGRGRAGRGRSGAAKAEPGCPARGEQGAGVASAWGAGSGAQKNEESGEEQKNKWDSQIGCLCSSTREHNDPPYISQLPDLAEEHKSLCSSEI
jgi:hypothetical protein